MNWLYLDLETYSETPITHGTHAYAASAEILLFAYAIDDGPVQVWDRSAEWLIPEDLCNALDNDSVIVCAHNSQFDRTVLHHAGWHVPIHRWRDTMVKAMAHSLPGSLGQLCDILKIDTDKAKDKDGKALVQLFCKPRPKTSKIRRATRDTHPLEWERFVGYARLDIEAMRAIDVKLPAWNYQGAELALWHLDQTINDRGVQIDLDLAHAAVRAVDRAQTRLAEMAKELTDGAVAAATQRDAVLSYITNTYGMALNDLRGSTVEKAIASTDLPEPVRELLQVRLQASTTSTAKYRTLLNATSHDHRLRGTLQFNGASRTGRWAGRLFQPQNLPRPELDNDQILAGIDALKADCEDLVTDDVMQLTSSAIRGCIVAPTGRKLVVSDLSNIEGRDQAWLAGETWKLAAFRAFDAGCGPDLYKLAYAKSFGVRPEDVTKDQRQIGKVQELALGYQGGVGAFVTFASAYGINLDELAAKAWDAIPADILEQSIGALAWTKEQKRPRHGLPDRTWIVCESFKRSWREAHSQIASYWRELEDAAHNAITRPGETFDARKLKLKRSGAWLRIRLPSGRFLCYPSPAISDDNKITYMGVNQYTRKWERLTTYGGKLFENVCQAVARDVLAYNLQGMESRGYSVVLTVHDEVICEAPDADDYDDAELSRLLSKNPTWAPDMPLASAGFQAYRYKKD